MPADFGDGNSACLYRILNDRRIEILKLIDVGSLEIMQMQDAKFRVSQRIEYAFVISTAIELIIGNGSELTFRIEDADQCSRSPNFLNMLNVIEA